MATEAKPTGERVQTWLSPRFARSPSRWEIEEEAARTRATKAPRPVEVLTFDLG